MQFERTVLALLLLLVVSCSTAYDSMELLWSDEFDNDASSDPNPLFWSYDLGGGGWGNGELQTYTVESAKVESGSLHIRVDADDNGAFTSARIKTEDKVLIRYGTIVARIMVPDIIAGLWPAFWTLGEDFQDVGWINAGEIDIMEIGQGLAVAQGVGNRRVVSAAHWEHNEQYATYARWLDVSENLNGTFHLYRLDWTPEALTTYVDDQEIWKMDITEASCTDCTELHKAHFLVLNIAVGGGFTSGSESSSGSSGVSSGFGSSGSSGAGNGLRTAADITAPLPANMLVDFVRVYQNGHAEVITPLTSVCGDGVLDHGEECDDGNDIDDDACRNDCTIPFCEDVIGDTGDTGGESMDLLWSDEFNHAASPDPNPLFWSYDLGSGGWGNGELQTYTVESAKVESGSLHIRVDADNEGGFTSARIKTEDKVLIRYGTIVARIMVPDIIAGLWPAFWTLGEDFQDVGWINAGEIDIMEIGQGLAVAQGVGNRRVVSAAHWEHNEQYATYARWLDVSENLNGTFHLYRLDWTPEALTTYVDDQEIWKMDITEASCTDCTELHKAHFLVLNIAVGGGFTSGSESSSGSSGVSSGFGSSGSSGAGNGLRTAADITAPLPADMFVDYIRVYQNGHAEVIAPTVPACVPTASPSLAPTKGPTPAPSVAPTKGPTTAPSAAPTKAPTPAPSAAPTDSPRAPVTGTSLCTCQANATYDDSSGAGIVTIDFAMCGAGGLRSDWIGIYPCDARTIIANDENWAQWRAAVALDPTGQNSGYVEGQEYVAEQPIWFSYTCGSPSTNCQHISKRDTMIWPEEGTVTLDPSIQGNDWAFGGIFQTRTLEPGCYKALLNRDDIGTISPPPYPVICGPWDQALKFYVPN